MRVAVLGGTGVFGLRVADLLSRDGHEVLIVARDRAKLDEVAARLGVEACACDAGGDLGPVWDWKPDLLCDAIGPFRAGPGCYTRIEACLARGIDYADLCDDAAFAAGVVGFDEAARRLGRRVLCGVSSVPALSSSVVADLSQGWDRVDSVRTAIVPGNRAPRGPSVVEGILQRMGMPMATWEGGVVRRRRTWSQRRVVELAPGLRRAAWNIEVPDTTQMAPWSGARTATFHAGLELPLFGWGLWAVSLARGVWRWPWPRWALRAVVSTASWFDSRGTDVGGMLVEVRGWKADRPLAARWSLVARQGHGPWVPAVPMRALARVWKTLPVGARVAMGEVGRGAMERALDDLDVVCTASEAPSVPLFQAALGPSGWPGLGPAWRATHEVLDTVVLRGRGRVVHGTGFVARVLGALFRFPPASEDVPVEVVKTRTAAGETWVRAFDGRRFRSRLSQPDGLGGVTEAFGPFAFRLALVQAAPGAPLAFQVRSATCAGLPWPKWALPRVVAQEVGVADGVGFDVRIDAPLRLGTIVHYTGALTLTTGVADMEV